MCFTIYFFAGRVGSLFMTLARDASLSLREGVPALGPRTGYLKHFREAGQAGTRPAGRDPEPARGRRHRKRDLKYYTNRPGPGRNPPRRPAGHWLSLKNIVFFILECRPWASGPIIYDTSARRVAQFARGSAGPASPAPLFTALPRDGCLSSREAVLVGRRPPHYFRHFWEGRGVPFLGCQSAR